MLSKLLDSHMQNNKGEYFLNNIQNKLKINLNFKCDMKNETLRRRHNWWIFVILEYEPEKYNEKTKTRLYARYSQHTEEAKYEKNNILIFLFLLFSSSLFNFK